MFLRDLVETGAQEAPGVIRGHDDEAGEEGLHGRPRESHSS